MATVNEVTVSGRKFRKLVDEATKLWQKISFWTKASDVEFDDGMTAEIKMGAVDGITDSLASTSSKIAASAKALKQVNDKLAQGRLEFVVNDDGSIGYRLDGADTVLPFNSRFNGVIMRYYKKSTDSSAYLSIYDNPTTGYYNYGAAYDPDTRKTTIKYPGRYSMMISDNNGYAACYLNDEQIKIVSYSSIYFAHDLKEGDVLYFTGSQTGAHAYIEKISD